MEGSFEGILARLRGEDLAPEPEDDATAPAGSPLPPIEEEGDVSSLDKKPLSLAVNMPVTNHMAQTLGEALLVSDSDVSDIKLQLYWMSPHPTAFRSLLRYLRSSSTLHTISLFGNPTGDPGCRGTAEQILQAVAENANIQHLNLAWIELSRASIACQRHATELILIRSTFSDNENDDEEENDSATSPSEEKPSKLRSLIIDVWDKDSIKTLVAIGAYHTSVNTLYVRYPLSMVEVDPVIEFIRLQRSLKEVLLRNCGADLAHMACIVAALPEATTTVEVVNGYWDSPEMRDLVNTPQNERFQAHKTSMIKDMARTNSLIMLHCYVTTSSSKRDSLFTREEELQIQATGGRNFVLPRLMKGSNLMWDNPANWPTMLELAVQSDHPIHRSLVFEVVRDRLMQCPALLKRTVPKPVAEVVSSPRPAPPHKRFIEWIRRRKAQN